MRATKNQNKIKGKALNHKVKIIAGSLRGRNITFDSGEGLRPTLSQVRETLFNWLSHDINQAHCLDLYAGSGALGFEAASRGASSVVMVDASSAVVHNLQKNIQQFSTSNITTVHNKAEDFLKKNKQLFDIVFLDPPFEKDMLKIILSKLLPHLSENALIYIEQEMPNTINNLNLEWKILKTKKTSRLNYGLISIKNS